MNVKLTKTFAMLVAVSAAGCAHSPTKDNWPVAPDALYSPFNPFRPCKDEEQSTAGCIKPGDSNQRMTAIEGALAKRIELAYQTGKSAMQRDWGTGDLVTAGGLMAVLGGIADRTGLVNTGAAAGLLGGSGRARYQYSAQTQAYEAAASAFACVQTQVQLFDDESRNYVLKVGDAEERATASKAPNLAINAVNKASRRLFQQLQQLSAEPMQRESIDALVKKVRAAEAAASAASATNADTVARLTNLVPSPPPSEAENAQILKMSEVEREPAKRALALAKQTRLAEDVRAKIEDARAVGRAFEAELAKCTAW